MQIQKINMISFDKKNSIQKTKHNTPAFKGYGETMTNVVKRDLKDLTDVSSAFRDLYNALKSSSEVKISPELALLESHGLMHISDFMEKICAPIAQVPSSLRDIVFKTEEENINLLENDEVGHLLICNFGKKGFLNSIFNSQDARNDIKFLFSSPTYDSFEIGINKNGGLHVEQIDYPNYIISDFGILSRRSKKTGTYDTTTPILPPY